MRARNKVKNLLTSCLSIALSLLLTACSSLLSPALQSTPSPGPRFPLTGETGIQGRAFTTIRTGANQYTAPAPLQVTVIIEDSTGNEVATVQTDADGYFRVLLSPGTYALRLDTTSPLAVPQGTRTVMVQENQLPYVELAQVIPLT